MLIYDFFELFKSGVSKYLEFFHFTIDFREYSKAFAYRNLIEPSLAINYFILEKGQ